MLPEIVSLLLWVRGSPAESISAPNKCPAPCRLAELLARVAVSRLPTIATTARSLRAREGKVYLDVVQNGRGQLLAAPYAVRPKSGGPVSTPLDWSEVQDSLDVRTLNLRKLLHRLAGLARDPLLAILDESPDIDHSLALLGHRLAE